MVVYKVFCKNYELRKGELMGALIERRKDLRSMKQFESGLKWGKLTFGHMVQDKKAIFVVPSELKIEDNPKRYMEKGIFNKEEYLKIMNIIDREMKKECKGN